MAEPDESRYQPRFTVSSLTEAISQTLRQRFSEADGREQRVYVEGEISDFRQTASGHVYFTLKDDKNQIAAAMFAPSWNACKARDRLKNGTKILAYARVAVYGPRGYYQLVVLAAREVGLGELMQRYLELKDRLEKEGLFAPSRKRPLPRFPRHIGVVSSESGAVIHDICTVLLRRFPHIRLTLYPSLVQGELAPPTLIEGLAYFAAPAHQPDLIILARGGGSFEDLFCFNDEGLVRAIAASPVPVISAVGHETDFTLADFVADQRAGTPSIAAEIAVPDCAELNRRLNRAMDSLLSALRAKGEWFAQRLDQLTESLNGQLTRSADRMSHRLALLSESLNTQLVRSVEQRTHRFELARTRLDLLSPYAILDRGYSITTASDGRVIKSSEALSSGDLISTRFADGSVESVVQKMPPKIKI